MILGEPTERQRQNTEQARRSTLIRIAERGATPDRLRDVRTELGMFIRLGPDSIAAVLSVDQQDRYIARLGETTP